MQLPQQTSMTPLLSVMMVWSRNVILQRPHATTAACADTPTLLVCLPTIKLDPVLLGLHSTIPHVRENTHIHTHTHTHTHTYTHKHTHTYIHTHIYTHTHTHTHTRAHTQTHHTHTHTHIHTHTHKHITRAHT